jgi:hypothetical protein
MLMTDIAIEHTKKSRKGGPDETFLMHPFENSRGSHAGKYEVLIEIVKPGQGKCKRSIHVNLLQLAELYARGLTEILGIRLRLRPEDGSYPTAPPGKKVSASFIRTGSEFHHLVQGVDVTLPVSFELKAVLERLKVHL